MPLKLSLRPGEKFVVNGAVVQNGFVQARLPVEACLLLDIDDAQGVAERFCVLIDNGAADDEVEQEGEGDEEDFEDIAVNAPPTNAVEQHS